MSNKKIDFNDLLNKINIYSSIYTFISSDFKLIIKNVINDLFPKLNIHDTEVLLILSCFIIEIISNKYGFNSTNEYYHQWKQNNYRDIKSAILLLLPFIDDDDNGYLLKKLTDLNQLLYGHTEKTIPKYLLDMERFDILKSHFEFGNMGLGLIKNNSGNSLLDLYIDNTKLIYKLMYHNLFGLLQTLEIINGKSYINWVNIIPLNLNNYYESKIVQETINKFDDFFLILINKNNPEKLLSQNLINYNGIWFGDFYNIIRNKFYEHAKPIKWLIFPYEISDTNKIYLINGLNKFFDLENIINTTFNDYNDLDNHSQFLFNKSFNELIINLKQNNTLVGLIKIDFEIIKYLLIYFINNYNKQILSGDVFNKFKLIDDTDETDDFSVDNFKKINSLTNDDIMSCLYHIKNNNISDLWNYLNNSLIYFIDSSYGKFLIQKNKDNKYYILNKYYYEPFNESFKQTTLYQEYKTKLNLKNIYNIAKSLSHNNTKDWNLLDENYISLNNETKIDFFNKIMLINRNIKNWINLKGNLYRQFIGVSYDYYLTLTELLKSFGLIYNILVIEELVTNGILNEFKLNKNITDNMMLPLDTEPKKSEIKKLLKKNFNDNKKEWLESYYYLTNDKYKNLKNIRLEKRKNATNTDKYNEYNYFDLISEDHEWPNYYAMNWISQISFFQHYIYHQVLYITGATGQGKSTQVPKLLLYAMKMIDYKSNGKIVCTQPRIPPTENNAIRISEELGLPIEQPSNNSIYKIKTDNYYVQFKHQKKAYIKKNANYNTLSIVTDGTLLEVIKKNPTMFEKVNDKFINKNIYDIIIIDEAHEHGANMDIIIALARQTCYFNNKIKLIIVSATMDDDDPIYRRYFSPINDNLMYPIKYPLLNPFNNTLLLPQPIFMDRRYHISPPGETTQYKIVENYISSDLSQKEIINEGYKTIIDICNKSTSGEILLFANGINDIMKAVKYLNTVLPDGNIVIPYYSELNDKYKDFISKIDKSISKIINKRENVYLEWTNTYIENPIEKVANGTYKRSIIVSTNIAEASITIPGLKYVVDHGYSKVSIFNPISGLSTLQIKEISESSRKQRKGRVGRKGDGFVYYLYKKNARLKNKPKYEITQKDMSNEYINLLAFIPFDKINVSYDLIVTEYFNPNFYLSLKYKDEILFTIYKKNYNINNKDLDPIYWDIYDDGYVVDRNDIQKFGTDKTYSPFNVFFNGQLDFNIIDRLGKFYLIHPFEGSIKRNILNNIIEFNNYKLDIIPINEYRYIFLKLISKNLLINKKADINYQYDRFNEEYELYKTELGENVINIMAKYEVGINDAITIIAATAMGCLNEVNDIRLLLSGLKNLSEIISPNIKINDYKKSYPNIKSDLIFLYEIIKKIKKYILIDYQSNLVLYNNELDKFIKLSNIYSEPPKDFDGNLWNKLMVLKHNGTLRTKYEKIFKSDNYTKKIIINRLDKNKSEIQKWCNTNHLNYTKIYEFIEKLVFYNLNIDLSKESIVWAQQLSNSFNKALTNYSIEEKIIRSFLYGYADQYTLVYSTYDRMLSHINFTMYNAVNDNDGTITNLSNNLVFYLKYDIIEPTENSELEYNNIKKNESDKPMLNISILSKIETSWLLSALPLIVNHTLKPNMFKLCKNIYPNVTSEIEIYNSFEMQIFRNEIINHWKPTSNVWINNITPLIKYYYEKIEKK